MNYGRAIKTIRAARGIPQKDFTERLELDRSYVSLIETGKRVPSLGVLEKIAAALRVPQHLLVLMAQDRDELWGMSAADVDKSGSALTRAMLEPRAPAPRPRPRSCAVRARPVAVRARRKAVH